MRSRRFHTTSQLRQVPSTRPNFAHFYLPFSSQRRLSHEQHGVPRLSEFWTPTGGITASTDEQSHALLVRAGFLRQTHSGIFHLLPLGVRVQEKVERLIDKHMLYLGASKVALSTFSSKGIWRASGRLGDRDEELFHLKDRKGYGFLLSPTHEEEITSLVGSIARSHKDLPLRLYQVSRKYRDELRPRQGLLRSREFLMKDLYTFDISHEAALETYKKVRESYRNMFTELRLPYIQAQADSGSIGGELSHEYHLPSDHGEDRIITCNNCRYARNEELTGGQVIHSQESVGNSRMAENDRKIKLWRGTTHDRSTLVEIAYPGTIRQMANSAQYRETEISTTKIKYLVPDIDLSVDLSPEDGLLDNYSMHKVKDESFRKRLRLNDHRVAREPIDRDSTAVLPSKIVAQVHEHTRLDLIRPESDDLCPQCSQSTIKVTKAIEIGHTFHLGTRYSKPLGLSLASGPSLKPSHDPEAQPVFQQEKKEVQMGCHGIGISRMIAAVASILADGKGLNWPRLMAPFQVVIIARKDYQDDATLIYEKLMRKDSASSERDSAALDAIIDDRDGRHFVWKLTDADLIGYPVIIVLGKNWPRDRLCEVQCRRLKTKEVVHFDNLSARVRELLEQL